MLYDKELYRRVITPQIKLWMQSRPGVDPVSEISNIALTTSCPIVVVCQLIEDIYGVTPELTRLQKRLGEFYA